MPSQSVGLHPGSNRLNRGDQLFDAGFELSWLGHEGSEREIEAVAAWVPELAARGFGAQMRFPV